MSVDWTFDFSVLGPDELIEQFAAALKDMRWQEEPEAELFEYTHIVDRASGRLPAQVGRNYYGCASIEDMAAQFPGLTFKGAGWVDVDYLLNFLFESRDGETTWRTVRKPDDELLSTDPPEEKALILAPDRREPRTPGLALGATILISSRYSRRAH